MAFLGVLVVGFALQALVGLVVVVVAFLSLRQSRLRVERWEAAARTLGLGLEGPARRGLFGRGRRRDMVGTWHGVPVRARHKIVSSGSGQSRSSTTYTVVRAAIEPPLALGLQLTERGSLSRLLGIDGGLKTGHAELDGRIKVRAGHPAYTARLLTHPSVLPTLEHLVRGPLDLDVLDTAVILERRETLTDAAPLAQRLDSVTDLARRLTASRRALGATEQEGALRGSWREVASHLGLDFDADRLHLAGRVDGMFVEAEAQMRGPVGRTVFRARYDRPLGLSLRLARSTDLDGLGRFFGMQDIRTGDRMFDDRFVVKGEPEAAVKELLTEGLRAVLLELQGRSRTLVVEDDHLEAQVDWWVTDAEGTTWALKTVARAGGLLASVVQEEIGPYR
jgi:hypothetical protein